MVDPAVDPIRVRVYVDGFNLYYGARDAVDNDHYMTGSSHSWKWLDVEALCSLLVIQEWPQASITYVGYFAAHVKPRSPLDTTHERQEVYLRALQRRGVDVVLGHFLAMTKKRPLVAYPRQFVEIHDTEEKGSDVNLATRLLADFFMRRADFDCAVVVSNDSDLAMPVELLRGEGLPVGILNPHRTPTPKLWPRNLAPPHFGRRIEVADLTACQLPDPLTDRSGGLIVSKRGNQIRRPPEWA